MDRLFNALRPLIRGVVRYAGAVVGTAIVLTLASLYLASGLRIDTDFAKLLPSDYPSVRALTELRETVGGESQAAVAIQSPSFEANRRFAKALIPRALKMTQEGSEEPFFRRAVFRRDANFLEDNALYFASNAELDTLEAFLEDKIREAKEEVNPFAIGGLEVEGAAPEDDSTGQRLEEIYRSLTVSEYMVSPDSTVLVTELFPAEAQTNVGFIRDAYAALEQQVDQLDPSSFHPQMEVTLAGRLLRQQVEVDAIQEDVLSSFGYGILAVLLFVTLYFLYKAYYARTSGRLDRRVLLEELARTPVLALVIVLPLLMSLAWTGAAGYLAFETLNLMTSTLGLVLFGLGIDFGIHFYARYTEERAEGRSVAEAAEHTFVSTGQAITVGAFTTAAGLFVLSAADFRGFSEFGFLAGVGILFALVAMTLVLPALLTVFERVRLLDLGPARVGVQASGGSGSFPAVRPVIGISAVAVVLGGVLTLVGFVSFEYDFGELEPDYEAYDAKDNIVERATEAGESDTDRPRNPAYVLTDSRDEVAAVTAAVRQKMRRDTLSPTIHSVESLQERFPLDSDSAQSKLRRIAEIRRTINENRYLRSDTSQGMERLRRAASTHQAIPVDSVPDYLRGRFTSKQGEVGGFVMIYPSVGLSHGQKSMAFREDVGTIETESGEVYHAGSTSLVAAAMLDLMLREAPWMVLATFVIVAALMWINFRSVRWALLALVPLVVGIAWMLLIMALFGVQLNFYNLVVLPAILGIGNDAGVHLVHRYREEGPGSVLRVLRSTGEHVTMGSLTTMIGFGGLLLSFHPGLRSIGLLAVVGIGTTLLAAIVFLPALLQWLEDRRQTPHPHAAVSEEEGPAVNGADDNGRTGPLPASQQGAEATQSGK